jgi:hypothetical protein
MGFGCFSLRQDNRGALMLFLFLYNMSKGKETMAAEIAANIKKKGFILYKKDLNLCCVHFDDTAIGRIMRHINEYVKNPSYTPQKIEFAEQLQYDLFVDGIRENTEEWREKIVQRRLRYEETKKNNSDNSDNSDKKNNSDNCDNSDKTEKTSIDKKNTSEDNTVQSNQVQSNQVQSNQVQSNQTTSNDVFSTQINSKSKKEYQTSFFDSFSNKEYTANYLKEKKIYFKNTEAWENFFNYNTDTCHWALKPETAARRWFKNNPEDKGEAPKKEKTAPQPPATPEQLKPVREKIWQAIKEQIPTVDFKNWLAPLELVNITHTTDGDNIVLGTKSKFHAEYFAEKIQIMFRQTYFALTSQQVNALECQFVDGNEIKTMQILTAFQSEKIKQAAAAAKAAAAIAAEEASKKRIAAREKALGNIRANLNPGPNVYAEQATSEAPAPATDAEPEPEPEKPETPEELFARVVNLAKNYVSKGAYEVFTTIFKLKDYSENPKTKRATITLESENADNEKWCKREYEAELISAYEFVKDYKLTVKYVTKEFVAKD